MPQGVEPGGDLPWPVALALHRLLARSPAKLMAVQIEDVLGAVEQANLPGTMSEHPNWCRRLGRTLEDLDRSAALRELGGVVANERPSAGQPQSARGPS
jgi:4-alpha-glucanotransferase